MKKVKCEHCNSTFKSSSALAQHKWYVKRGREYYRRYAKRLNRIIYRSLWSKKNRSKINISRKKSYWNGRREKTLEENNKYFEKVGGTKKKFNGFWKKCLERDHYTCQKCSGKNNVHVHHLRYGDDIELKDLITLCASCHMALHAKERFTKWE